MYARVARWEGGSADQIGRATDEIRSRTSEGPPEGVPAKGFLLLTDPENGRVLAVALFETEADMRTGDEALNAMNPPGDGMGRRVSVEMYEVAADERL
jgi:hypothetical protein